MSAPYIAPAFLLIRISRIDHHPSEYCEEKRLALQASAKSEVERSVYGSDLSSARKELTTCLDNEPGTADNVYTVKQGTATRYREGKPPTRKAETCKTSSQITT